MDFPLWLTRIIKRFFNMCGGITFFSNKVFDSFSVQMLHFSWNSPNSVSLNQWCNIFVSSAWIKLGTGSSTHLPASSSSILPPPPHLITQGFNAGNATCDKLVAYRWCVNPDADILFSTLPNWVFLEGTSVISTGVWVSFCFKFVSKAILVWAIRSCWLYDFLFTCFCGTFRFRNTWFQINVLTSFIAHSSLY